jgi:adenosylhomocysteine nucleosidase
MHKIILFLLLSTCFSSTVIYADEIKYAVIVSADMEWKAVKKVFPDEKYQKSAWGEYFYKNIKNHNILFFHEGWGKVAAAGATQYVIDKFGPQVLINIGTCGGIEGETKRFDVILAERTVIYDIKEAMGDSKEAISDYSTKIDLSWLGSQYPETVKKALIISGDRDLVPDEIPFLKSEYGAVAGDWETGAIAYVANKNKVKLVILRGVSDIVSVKRGEAYGNFDLFVERAEKVMRNLINQLPEWIEYIHMCLTRNTGQT